ncbi:MAG TPA: putative lipid II flippase FtsW [Armatimonadota bacterium]
MGATAHVPVRPVDPWLLLVILTLVFVGTFFVFDASYVKAIETSFTNNDPFYFIKRQLVWVVVGFAAFGFGMKLGYWNLRRVAPTLLLIAFLLLIAVLIPGIGRKIEGARRWMQFGPVRLQPSEVAKIFLMIFVANYLAQNPRSIRRLQDGFLPILALIGVVCGLILIEPDMGTMLATVGVSTALLFVGGARGKHIAMFIAGGVVAVGLLCVIEPWRMERLLAFLNPWHDPDGSGYQVLQGLAALGSGGVFGLGPGESRAKWLYLPAEHTDFIFAIIGEEIGLLGGLGILGLFLFLAWRGFVIAGKCTNRFGRLLAIGIALTIGGQAMMNICVVCTLLPATGVPLPLISFGGSSLVLTMFALGVLTDISRRPKLPWDNEDHDSGSNRRWDRGPYIPGSGDRRGSRKTGRVPPVYR